mgnify:CR=1 FL=1
MWVIVKPSAEKQLNRIPSKVAEKITEVIVKLQENPFPTNSKKLQAETDIYRIRVGDYRIVYEIEKITQQIVVAKIKHRKDVYR